MIAKMVKISHYAFIADVLVTAALNKVGQSSPRYVPGDRCLGVLPFSRKCLCIHPRRQTQDSYDTPL